jgi:hypothetical protein
MKALLVIAAFAATILTFSHEPGWAWGNHGRSQPSVFPQPADPWSHWGRVHSPTVILSPRAPAVVVRPGAVVHSPRPVWVPGFWTWNGFSWVWSPGAWSW